MGRALAKYKDAGRRMRCDDGVDGIAMRKRKKPLSRTQPGGSSSTNDASVGLKLFLRGRESGRPELACSEFGPQLSLCFLPVLLIPVRKASSLTPDVYGPLRDLFVAQRDRRLALCLRRFLAIGTPGRRVLAAWSWFLSGCSCCATSGLPALAHRSSFLGPTTGICLFPSRRARTLAFQVYITVEFDRAFVDLPGKMSRFFQFPAG